MRLSYEPFDLIFKHPFTVSGFSRTSTPIVISTLTHEGIVGYGESTMPPYLGETKESVIDFLKQIDLSTISDPFQIKDILIKVDGLQQGNNAAKAGFDIALHDLICKLKGITVSEFYSIPKQDVLTSFTIGIDTPELMVEKVLEAISSGFKVLKIKLGSEDDMKIMTEILKVWNGPFSIDANQGWKDKNWGLEFTHFLKAQGCMFIEQPFSKEDLDSHAWLTERSPLPVIADESIKRLSDLESIQNCFHGINVKLMKSTGLSEAYQIIQEAKKKKMKVVTGCMAESSCAVSAMANLAPLADWVDLDGPFLITNDPFTGILLENGKLVLDSMQKGIGVIRNF